MIKINYLIPATFILLLRVHRRLEPTVAGEEEPMAVEGHLADCIDKHKDLPLVSQNREGSRGKQNWPAFDLIFLILSRRNKW